MESAELVARRLESESVEHGSGMPGEENFDRLDALIGSPIQSVSTRHEQGAAFVADVYGRLTGRTEMCLSTLGPGAANLATGVADAKMDRAPERRQLRHFGRATALGFGNPDFVQYAGSFGPLGFWV